MVANSPLYFPYSEKFKKNSREIKKVLKVENSPECVVKFKIELFSSVGGDAKIAGGLCD